MGFEGFAASSLKTPTQSIIESVEYLNALENMRIVLPPNESVLETKQSILEAEDNKKCYEKTELRDYARRGVDPRKIAIREPLLD